MALQTAHGGHVYIGAVVFPNETWRGSWQHRNVKIVQSDSGGAETNFPTGVQVNEWEVTLARDDAAFPEAVGMQAGTIKSVLYFALGSAGKSDKVTNTTVDSVETVNDNKGDAIRVTVRGSGGKCFPNTTVGA